ncbi:Ribonucleoside-diphosphate reductase large subunit [uncultured virus]|nr:Ribonucleoside-diphosphate reductase large subunit [uncultured virus]
MDEFLKNEDVYVIKRSGLHELVSFDKILERIKALVRKDPPLTRVNHVIIAQKTIQGLYKGVTTSELDTLAAETAAYMSTTHPEYDILAARIAISNLQKSTSSDFMKVTQALIENRDPKNDLPAPRVSNEYYQFVKENIEAINEAIDYERDYLYEYFGYKVLEKSYLLRSNGKIVERPQATHMRVALGVHLGDLDKALQVYRWLSLHFMTYATPTIMNAGTPFPQLSSCFLLAMKEDSIAGIYKTLADTALLSKHAGGIGLSISNVRATQSYIRGTDGNSDGIVPMLRVYNDTARYVNQGGGKRKGSFAIYLEPWHPDIEVFLELKRPGGTADSRLRDLFYGLWIPDLFMSRVERDESWSLFCPDECPGLNEVWGVPFEELYTNYEKTGKARKVLKARDLWDLIITSQIETGTPYMLYKDACNRKSNQQNLGTIKSSNLCTEIIQYSSADEIANCNLSSLALPKFVIIDDQRRTFDHQLLYEVTYALCHSMNCVIDRNHYVLPETKRSNLRHRPIAMGVQGLANVFMMMRYPFDSLMAKKLNIEIFETIYYGFLRASCDLAKIHGPYETFQGSPYSKGILAFDMAGVQPTGRWPFDEVRGDIVESGIRNCLGISVMPTASTASILGNNECIEPFTCNFFNRRVLAGEFTIVNRYLIDDLEGLGLWNEKMKNEIFLARGSIQSIERIPSEIRHLHRTVWELKMRDLIDMAADRGAFIDQSQSLNMFMAVPDKAKITSMHLYGWKKGLKTGMYYLRTRPAADPIQFTIDPTEKRRSEEICKMEDGCIMCSG